MRFSFWGDVRGLTERDTVAATNGATSDSVCIGTQHSFPPDDMRDQPVFVSRNSTPSPRIRRKRINDFRDGRRRQLTLLGSIYLLDPVAAGAAVVLLVMPSGSAALLATSAVR